MKMAKARKEIDIEIEQDGDEFYYVLRGRSREGIKSFNNFKSSKEALAAAVAQLIYIFGESNKDGDGDTKEP